MTHAKNVSLQAVHMSSRTAFKKVCWLIKERYAISYSVISVSEWMGNPLEYGFKSFDLRSYSSHCCCEQFHTGLEQLGTRVIWRSLDNAQRVSDFLPRAPPTVSVRALQRVWQAHRHNTYMFEGELADKWFPFLLLCWVVLIHARRLLRTPLDQANSLPLRRPIQ